MRIKTLFFDLLHQLPLLFGFPSSRRQRVSISLGSFGFFDGRLAGVNLALGEGGGSICCLSRFTKSVVLARATMLGILAAMLVVLLASREDPSWGQYRGSGTSKGGKESLTRNAAEFTREETELQMRWVTFSTFFSSFFRASGADVGEKHLSPSARAPRRQKSYVKVAGHPGLCGPDDTHLSPQNHPQDH